MGEPVVLVVRYRCRAGQGDAVAAALREMIPLARAEEGCEAYLVQRAVDDPDRFVLYERYSDEAGFQAHMETPHFAEIVLGRVVPLLDERERGLFSPVEP